MVVGDHHFGRNPPGFSRIWVPEVRCGDWAAPSRRLHVAFTAVQWRGWMVLEGKWKWWGNQGTQLRSPRVIFCSEIIYKFAYYTYTCCMYIF